MLYLDYKSVTKGVVHYAPNALYTLPGILSIALMLPIPRLLNM